MKGLIGGALALALAGAGCATVDPDGPKPVKQLNEFRLADGTLVVCRMEADTGSNIRERVCRTVEGTTLQQRVANDQFMSPQQAQRQQ